MDQNSLNTNPSNSGLNTTSPSSASNQASAPVPAVSATPAQTPTPTPLPKITTPVSAMKKHVERVGSMDSHKLAQRLFWLVLTALVVVGGYLLYGQISGSALGPTESPGNASKVPVGFPDEIPLEESNIISSDSYVNEDGLGFSVVYKTEDLLAEKYDEYISVLSSLGYKINSDQPELTNNLIIATRYDEVLSIAFYTNNQVNHVDVKYNKINLVDESSI